MSFCFNMCTKPNVEAKPYALPGKIDPKGWEEKAMHYEKKALEIIAVVGMILLFPITIPLACAYKVYTHFRVRDLVQELGRERFNAVREALTKENFIEKKDDKKGDKKLTKNQILLKLVSGADLNEKNASLKNNRTFFNDLYSLYKLIDNPGNDLHDHMQNVRAKTSKLLESEYYTQHCDKNDKAVQFLETISYTFVSDSPGMKVIESHGKQLFKEINPEAEMPTIKNLVDIADNAVYDYKGFKTGTLPGKVFWIFAHPQKFANSILGHQTWYDYNSYAHGNANTKIYTVNIRGKKFTFILGPSPTGDNLFKAYLKKLEKDGKVHIQHSLQFSGVKSEHKRNFIQIGLENMREAFRFMITPLDGKIWNGKKEFKTITNAPDFVTALKKHIFVENGDSAQGFELDGKKDNGFYFGEGTLDKPDIESALNKYQTIFQKFEKTPYWEALAEKSPKRLCKAQLLASEMFLMLKTLHKAAEKEKAKDIIVGQACKQDIDRGVLMNIMMMVAFDSMNCGLSEDRMYQILGILNSRAGMVDDRSILTKRYEALSDLLHIIAENPKEFESSLIKAFGPLEKPIEIT